MKIQNKEVIQSYLMTSAKYNFSIYEKRILYRVIEIAQSDTKGKKLDKTYTIGKTLFDDRILKIKTSDFLKDSKDNNYFEVKKALTSLRNKTIEYETDKVWKLIGIIEKPTIDKYDSFATFEIQPEIWKAILNFSKGYSKYELAVAMAFNSVYSMRFYELFSNNLKPTTLRIDDLKERFGISEKYKNRPADFILNVVEFAKKELDKKSEVSFNYSKIKEGRKVTMIKFVPYYIASNANEEKKAIELQKKISLRFDFNKDFLEYLNSLGFTEQGIRNNIKLFRSFNSKGDLYGFLKKINRNASKAANPQGYMIGAMKTYMKKMEFEVQVNEEDRSKVDDILSSLSEKLKK